MTREAARKMAEVMLAYAEGKNIQFAPQGTESWQPCKNPMFNFIDYAYKVHPELKYRPFKDADECLEEIKKHNPLGWVRNKCKERLLINRIDNNGIEVDEGGLCMSFEWAIIDEHIKFVDGTPFGIKES